MKEHNQDDWYSFDSVENYNFESNLEPPYKIVMTNTTGVNMFTILKSEEELREEKKMRRLRILICLK